MAQVNLYEYLDQIRDLLDQEHYTQAALHCHHILRQYPRHVETYRLLGQALLEQSSYQEASDLFLRILSVDPEDFIAHVGLSQIAKSDENYRRAIWHIERASDIRPNNEQIEEERRNLYDLAKVELPESAGLTQAAVARIYMRSGMYQQAISDLNSLLENEPNRLDARVLLAETYWAADKGGDASTQANKILDLLPDSYKAHAILADFWMQKEEMGHARSHLDKLGDILLPDKRFLDADTPSGRALTRASDDFIMQEILIDQADVAIDDVSLIGGSDSWRGQTGLLRSEDFNIDEELGSGGEDFEWLSFGNEETDSQPDDSESSKGDSDFLSLLAENSDTGRLIDDSEDVSDEDDAAFMAFLGFDDSEDTADEEPAEVIDDVFASEDDSFTSWLHSSDDDVDEATPLDTIASTNSDDSEIDFLDALMAEDDEPETMESSTPSWLSEEEERANNELGRKPTWLLERDDSTAENEQIDLYQAILNEDDSDKPDTSSGDDDWFAALEGGAGADGQDDNISWEDALSTISDDKSSPLTQEADDSDVPDWLATTSGVALDDEATPDWAQDFLTEAAEQNRSGQEGINDWIIGLEGTEDESDAESSDDLADIFATIDDDSATDDFFADASDDLADIFAITDNDSGTGDADSDMADFAALFDSPNDSETTEPDGSESSLDWLLGDTIDDGLSNDNKEATATEAGGSFDWLQDSQSELAESGIASPQSTEENEESSGFTAWLDLEESTEATTETISEETADEPSGFTAFLDLNDTTGDIAETADAEAETDQMADEPSGFTAFLDLDDTTGAIAEPADTETDQTASGFTAWLDIDESSGETTDKADTETDNAGSGFTAFLDLDDESADQEPSATSEDSSESGGFTEWLSLDGKAQTDMLGATESDDSTGEDFADWLTLDDAEASATDSSIEDGIGDFAAWLETGDKSSASDADFARSPSESEEESTVDTSSGFTSWLDSTDKETAVVEEAIDDTSSGFTGWLDSPSDDTTSVADESTDNFFAATEDSSLQVRDEAGFSDWLSGLDEENETNDITESTAEQVDEFDVVDLFANEIESGIASDKESVTEDATADDWLATLSPLELDEAADDTDLSWLGIVDDKDDEDKGEADSDIIMAFDDSATDIADLIPSSETEFDALFTTDDTDNIDKNTSTELAELDDDSVDLNTLLLENDHADSDNADDDTQIGLTDWLTDLSEQGLDEAFIDDEITAETGILADRSDEPIPTWLLSSAEDDDSTGEEDMSESQQGESWLSLLAEEKAEAPEIESNNEQDSDSIDDIALTTLSDMAGLPDSGLSLENEEHERFEISANDHSTATPIDKIEAIEETVAKITTEQEYVTDGDVPLPSWLVTATDEIDLHQAEDVSDTEMAAAVARVTQSAADQPQNGEKDETEASVDETLAEQESDVDDFAWVTIDAEGNDGHFVDDQLDQLDEELATQMTEVDEKVPTMSDLEDTLAFLEQLARKDIDSSKKKKDLSADTSTPSDQTVATGEDETLSWLDSTDDSSISNGTSLDLEEPPTLSWTTKQDPVSLAPLPVEVTATDDTESSDDEGELGWLDEWAETPIDETTLFAEPIPGLDDIIDEDLDDLASALDDLELPESNSTEGKDVQAGDNASESLLLDFIDDPEGDDLLGLDDLEANLDLGTDADLLNLDDLDADFDLALDNDPIGLDDLDADLGVALDADPLGLDDLNADLGVALDADPLGLDDLDANFDLGIDSDSFEVPDDPDELIAWLGGEDAVDAEPDVLTEMENLLVEPEPEPEPEPVAPPPPPKAEKKKSGGLFGGDDEDLGVTDEELAYAAEHGMELPDFNIPDDPDALMAWLEMDDNFDLGATTDESTTEQEVEPVIEETPEPEPEPVAPPPPPKAEKKKSGGLFGGDDEDLGVTDEELAYAAEHGMDLPDFDIPDDPDALMAWLEMDGSFDVGVTTEEPEPKTEETVTVETADPLAELELLATEPEPEPEPVAPPPPPKAEKKKSGGMFGGDDEDLGVTDEELAYAAEHGMELDIGIPDDPEALMAWLGMDGSFDVGVTTDESEPEPEPEPVTPPPPPKAEKKKSGGMFSSDDEDLGVTDEELAYAAEHGMELDIGIPDDPEALMAWLGMDGSFDVGTATDEPTAQAKPAVETTEIDDPLAELEALALGDTTSLGGLLDDTADTTGDDALSWLDEAITGEDDADSLPNLLLPDDPDAALAMIEQEAEDDYPQQQDDGVPTLGTLGFDDDPLLSPDEDLADFDLSIDVDDGGFDDLFGDLGSGDDSLDWLNDVTFDSDPNLLGPVPTEFELDPNQDLLSLPGLDDVPSDPDATFAMFEDLSAVDAPSQPLIDDTADQMARSALEEIDTDDLGSEDIVSLETGLTDSLPDWLSLEGDSSGLDWLDPSNDSNDLDWLSAVEEATRSTPDSGNDFLDLYEPINTSPSNYSASSSSSYASSRRSEPVASEPEIEEEAFEPVDPAVYEGARASLSQGDVDSALDAYREILGSKQNLRALAYELESVTMTNKHPLLRRFLGDVYMENGQLQKALNTYRQAQDLL